MPRHFHQFDFLDRADRLCCSASAIEKMQKVRAQEHMVRYGEKINNGWRKLAEKHGVDIAISGIPPLTHISFKADDPIAVQTFYTQEMLRGLSIGGCGLHYLRVY